MEGENSRLRHNLARRHHKTFCDSKSVEMLELLMRLFVDDLKHHYAKPARYQIWREAIALRY
ncbi:MAG: hypothetical protein N2235_15850 [Fischerella sp.]|nr:hypothetical protein [Fischerella sp.]